MPLPALTAIRWTWKELKNILIAMDKDWILQEMRDVPWEKPEPNKGSPLGHHVWVALLNGAYTNQTNYEQAFEVLDALAENQVLPTTFPHHLWAHEDGRMEARWCALWNRNLYGKKLVAGNAEKAAERFRSWVLEHWGKELSNTMTEYYENSFKTWGTETLARTLTWQQWPEIKIKNEAEQQWWKTVKNDWQSLRPSDSILQKQLFFRSSSQEELENVEPFLHEGKRGWATEVIAEEQVPALHMAARYSTHYQWLLERGVPATLTNGMGETALHYWARCANWGVWDSARREFQPLTPEQAEKCINEWAKMIHCFSQYGVTMDTPCGEIKSVVGGNSNFRLPKTVNKNNLNEELAWLKERYIKKHSWGKNKPNVGETPWEILKNTSIKKEWPKAVLVKLEQRLLQAMMPEHPEPETSVVVKRMRL